MYIYIYIGSLQRITQDHDGLNKDYYCGAALGKLYNNYLSYTSGELALPHYWKHFAAAVGLKDEDKLCRKSNTVYDLPAGVGTLEGTLLIAASILFLIQFCIYVSDS